MDPLSLIAIAVAFAVALFSLSRTAAARRELAAAREEIAALRKQLPRAEASPRREKPAAEPELADEPDEEPMADSGAPAEAADETPEEVPEEVPEEPPAVGPAVVARAAAILRDAKELARHIGFDHELKVGEATGVRVTVPVEDELDERAVAHLCATSDAVLEKGMRDEGHYLVIRR